MRRVDEKDVTKILLVGDSLSSDIQGANNAGIDCCWYNPAEASAKDGLRIDYQIRTIREIYQILGMEE